MTSKLLIEERPLQVLPQLASAIGLNEAIVLQQVHYWLRANRDARKMSHYIGDKWWTYNTHEAWQERNFPFWSVSTVRRIFTSLRDKGLLIAQNLSSDPYDRTYWYTIDYQKVRELELKYPCVQIEQMEPEQSPYMGGSGKTPTSGGNDDDMDNASVQNGDMSSVQNGQMYIKTETSTETTDAMPHYKDWTDLDEGAYLNAIVDHLMAKDVRYATEEHYETARTILAELAAIPGAVAKMPMPDDLSKVRALYEDKHGSSISFPTKPEKLARWTWELLCANSDGDGDDDPVVIVGGRELRLSELEADA